MTDYLLYAAREVIEEVRRNNHYPILLGSKLGDVHTEPLTDGQLTSAHDTPTSTLNRGAAQAIKTLARTDQETDDPLVKLAQWVDDVMARAAVVNR